MTRVRVTRRNSEKHGCVSLFLSRDYGSKRAFYSLERPHFNKGVWTTVECTPQAFRVVPLDWYRIFGIEEICEGELVEINVAYVKRLFNTEEKLMVAPTRI